MKKKLQNNNNNYSDYKHVTCHYSTLPTLQMVQTPDSIHGNSSSHQLKTMQKEPSSQTNPVGRLPRIPHNHPRQEQMGLKDQGKSYGKASSSVNQTADSEKTDYDTTYFQTVPKVSHGSVSNQGRTEELEKMIGVITCGKKWNRRNSSITIGAIMLAFSCTFLCATIGILAAWDAIDTKFFDSNLVKVESATAKSVRDKFIKLSEEFQKDIRPFWKGQFASLYGFLPFYMLVNAGLIIGSYHKVRILLMGWIIFTVVYLIWTQVLVSIMATKEVTADFLCGITIAQLANFTICSYFLGIVVTFYFEMKKVIVIEKNPRKMNHNRFQ